MLGPDDFSRLAPGETLDLSVNLVRSPTGVPRYKLPGAGRYLITAVFEEREEVVETVSNTIELMVEPGGTISGIVRDAADSTRIADAQVALFDANLFFLDRVSTDEVGTYAFPEVGPGDYFVQARRPGYLRSITRSVSVAVGADTKSDINLSALMTRGQIRFVLSWDAPVDLDAHLWLPDEVPYHLFFARKGTKGACPWAELDVDTTAGIGPETITVAERIESGSYTFAVHTFTGGTDIKQSEAKVAIFDSSGPVASFSVPSTGEGEWWHVVDVDGTTGALTDVNEIVIGNGQGLPDPAPYDDTGAGCPGTLSRAP